MRDPQLAKPLCLSKAQFPVHRPQQALHPTLVEHSQPEHQCRRQVASERQERAVRPEVAPGRSRSSTDARFATRISLDACRAALKTAQGPRQEQARLEVEQAEERLVNATEEAINLMRAVLDNVGLTCGF